MAVYTNNAASGSGQAALGMTAVTVAYIKVSALGSFASAPLLGDSDSLIRAGWVSFGVHSDPFGDGSQIYWDEPIWINFTLEHWPMLPTRLSGTYSQMSADTIRWRLAPGVTVKLYVFGS